MFAQDKTNMKKAKEIYKQLRERQLIGEFANEMGVHRNTVRNVLTKNKRTQWDIIDAAIEFIKDYDEQIKEYKEKYERELKQLTIS